MKAKEMVSKIREKIEANRFLSCVVEIVTRCFSHNIFGMAAELAYYFLFSFLPLILFGSSLLGLLNFDTKDLQYLIRLIPDEVMSIIRDYIKHIQDVNSPVLMYAGLILSIYFASSAMRSLMRSLDRAYAVTKRRHPVKQFILSVFFAVVFLVTILCSLLLMLAGGAIIDFVTNLFPQISYLSWLMHILRFAVLIFPIWSVLILLYLFTPNRRLTIRSALPGAFFSMATWMVVSGVFSTYISKVGAGKYDFLYGSLGAILVLMLWLYITGIIFILGGEFNFVFLRRREAKTTKQEIVSLENKGQNKLPSPEPHGEDDERKPKE